MQGRPKRLHFSSCERIASDKSKKREEAIPQPKTTPEPPVQPTSCLLLPPTTTSLSANHQPKSEGQRSLLLQRSENRWLCGPSAPLVVASEGLFCGKVRSRATNQKREKRRYHNPKQPRSHLYS